MRLSLVNQIPKCCLKYILLTIVLVVTADFFGGTVKDRDVWISRLTVGPLVPDITVLLVKKDEINLLVFFANVKWRHIWRN